MLESVSYLHIKPIVAYKNGDNHQSKLTEVKFQDVLDDEAEAKKTENSEKASEETASEQKSDSVYKDPVTGKEVVYVDVAKIGRAHV